MQLHRITIIFLLGFFVHTSAQIISSKTGSWNSAATWAGGVVPAAGDNVVISAGHVITLDGTNAQCNNLTVMGGSATFRFAIDGSISGITINGNLQINSGGRFRVESRNPVGAANSFVEHSLTIQGNLTNSGTVDLRGGSASGGSSNGVATTFSGTANTTISLLNTNYLASTEEFGSITINKSGGAKVILAAGNLFMVNSSSVGPCVLTFTNGIIETAPNSIWVNLTTGSTSVQGASTTRYISGAMGRGMNNSGGTEKKLEIGDGNGYRPVTIRSTTSGVASGHYVWARIISGSANTGSSTLTGGIDSVSSIRYYAVGYSKGGIAGAADSMSFEQFTPSYKADDGVFQGQTGVMVAYSTDNRASWVNCGPANHVADLSNPPTDLQSSTISPAKTLQNNAMLHLALAFGAGAITGPIPDSANASYGPFILNKYDLWKAPSDSATPLLVYIHGGGLTSGSKSDISLNFVSALLAKGISVMSINYRLSPEVIVPAHYLDCARAIQYARFNAEALNINPNKIGAGGSSAGALTSFWLAFHDDLADPLSPDPVLRQSSRLKGVTCWSGQTSVDKRVVVDWIGAIVLQFTTYFGGTIFGRTPETMDTPDAYAQFEMASPYNHANAGDPPVWMYYSNVNTPTTASEAIHHVNFGYRLKDRLDSLGIECSILTPAYTGSVTTNAVDFLWRVLNADILLPVELIEFSGNAATPNSVTLQWATATEVNSFKTEIERSIKPAAPELPQWKIIGEIHGAGKSSSVRTYSFTDSELAPGNYWYRLKFIDADGSFEFSNTIAVSVERPSDIFLSQNYPNPFNPGTTISYQIRKDADVILELMNVVGEPVRTLVNSFQRAGLYKFNFNAGRLSSGVYFYRLTVRDREGAVARITNKMLLLR